MRLMFSLIAALSGALFAGASLYINIAEHPARLHLDTRSAAAQWAASYRRATWMQAPLAIISFASGLLVWLTGGSLGWAFAALLLGSIVPFTFLGIMSTNNALLAPSRDLGSAETLALLQRWGRLHAVRTVLSLCGTALYFCLLFGAS